MTTSHSNERLTRLEAVAGLLSDRLPAYPYGDILMIVSCIGIDNTLEYLADINITIVEIQGGLRILSEAPHGDSTWAYLKLITLIQHLAVRSQEGSR